MAQNPRGRTSNYRAQSFAPSLRSINLTKGLKNGMASILSSPFREKMDLILAELADAIRNIRNVERLSTNDRTKEFAFFLRAQAERAIKKLEQFGTPGKEPLAKSGSDQAVPKL